MKTIEITIAPDGATTIETKGFAGRECLDATRALKAALGQNSGERLTSEFYAGNQNESNRLTARGDAG